jgi:hypothetical protein
MKTTTTVTLVVVSAVLLTTTASLARLGALGSWRRIALDLPAEADVELPNDDERPNAQPVAPPVALPPGAAPLAVAEEPKHDFGAAENGTKGKRHTFKVRNDGNAPLKLVGSHVSCTKCTFVDLPEEDIAPGETGEVVVRWNVDTYDDRFRQSASIDTNDPEHPVLRFLIEGRVVRPFEATPQELVFSNVPSEVGAEGKVRLLAYFDPKFEVTGQRLGDESTADFYDVSLAPLSREDLDAHSAKRGVEATIKVKPGLPLGQFKQRVIFNTNLENMAVFEVVVSGRVVGAVSIVGKAWDRDLNAVVLGSVKQSKGAKTELALLVKGPNREGLAPEPAIQPDVDVLEISYGEVKEINEGTITRIPLTLEIKPNSRLVNHMGGQQGKLAIVYVPLNKPELGKVKLLVRFAVVAD